MICTNCGSALKEGAEFCHTCGRRASVPVAAPAVKTPDPETASMKKAYSRAGLSTVALYGAMSVGQSIAIGLAAFLIVVLQFLKNNMPAFRLDTPSDLLQDATDWLMQSGAVFPMMLALVLGAAGGTLLGIFIMRKIIKRGTPIEKRSLSLGRFLVIALMCFGVWGAGALLGNLAELFGAKQESLFSVERLGKDILPYLIYAVIGAPILEELAFRKVLLDRLHDTHEGYAAVVSALLFGLMHGNHVQFFLAFFIGLIFAMVYQRTGRIIYTMILHAMINLTATIPELFALWGVDISLGWNIAVGTLIVGGLIALLVLRKDPLLHAEPCAIPEANRAVYKNVGMRIATIAGLVLIGLQGLMMIVPPMFNDPNPAYLIGLIPLALVFLTVLLLPKFTKRYEASAAKPEEETV